MTIGKQVLMICLFLLSLSFTVRVHAQGPEDPPRPIGVTTAQNISFGTFYHGPAGGSVIILPDGSRDKTSSVVLLFLSSFMPAIFEVTGNAGTMVTLSFGGPVTLTNGTGGSMTMNVGPSNPVSPFIITVPYPLTTQVIVGAVLSVGAPAANPPGTYQGTFSIIFNQN